jgi:DNA helicase-2/ATP-dependent DNA helicase PcrA
VRPSDIAVLCRKRSQFEALRRSLTARGIPCEVVGLGGLLTVPEVQDVVATLRVMHDASASDSLARILTGPRWRIGPRDLVALGRRARDLARGLHDADAEDEETDQESAGSPSAATAGEARTPSSAASATLPATPPGAGSSAAAPAPGQLPAMGPDTAAGSSSGAAPSVPGRSGPVAPPAQRSSPAYRSDGTPWPDEPSGDDDSWADAPLPPGPEDGWQPGPDDAGGRPAPAPRAAGPAGPASSASGSRATAPAGLATPLGRTAGPGPAATPGDQARATGGPGPVAGEPDAIDVAVNDLTAQSGSLVEALDDPGEPEGYSATGHARMRALARELRRLREHVSRPLPDLIAEVERALSLDIEVAARPGVDAAGARADLDKFTDVAAAFAGEQAEATLGAFLAYLTAAQQEEFGLETGQVGEADTVKLLTVHAAKGLQWPAVFVPGLSGGAKSQVFPAKPRQSTKWTDNSRLIPFGLRGDSADLPALDDLDSDGLAAFNAGCAARDVSEERRLAYVAATRAAFWLGCSGYWWGEGTAPLGPSVFLREARAACEAGAGTVGDWADPPGEEAENPLLATIEEADWPVTPAGQHYAAITAARQLVAAAAGRAASGAAPGASAGTPATAPLVAEAAAGDGAAAPARRRRRPAQGDMDSLFSADELASPPAPEDGLTPQERELVAAWDLDAGLLLAERERQLRRGDGPVPVLLPARLSVSALVALARDPDGLARQVRRPMPQPPARQARRGTAFHHWLEERFGQQRLIADDDLFADPDEGGQRGDTDLARLRDRFEASEWGSRFPREVEVPFDTLIGDRQIRGRIDAVFSDAGGNYDVVDWKTGQPPRTQPERDAVAVQLAAYRLAWATLAGVPLDRVRAAFYYVRWNVTVRPADLLDEAGLKALIDRVPVID